MTKPVSMLRHPRTPLACCVVMLVPSLAAAYYVATAPRGWRWFLIAWWDVPGAYMAYTWALIFAILGCGCGLLLNAWALLSARALLKDHPSMQPWFLAAIFIGVLNLGLFLVSISLIPR